jgi:DNA-binding GntR family transcriptional regulator
MPVKMIQKSDQPNNSITRIEEAYRKIKQMLFDQTLVPGQRLVNQDLVEKLNMSRTPIINALNRLVQDGFVAFESFRGFYVRPIDLQEVWDAFGVREALEVYTVEQAIKLSDNGDIQELENKLQEYADYQPHYYTRKKFLLDSAFHLQIADMAKNNVLKWLLKRNFEHIYLRARLENYDIKRMPVAVDEHNRLFRKMKNKDIIGSIELIRNHIQKARDLVIRSLTAEESDSAETAQV